MVGGEVGEVVGGLVGEGVGEEVGGRVGGSVGEGGEGVGAIVGGAIKVVSLNNKNIVFLIFSSRLCDLKKNQEKENAKE